MSNQTITSAESLAERVARLEAERAALEAERAALQAELDEVRRRERKRRERVEQKRASVAAIKAEIKAAQETPVHIDFERPRIPQQSSDIDLAARTKAITDPRELYLDLLKNFLTRVALGERQTFDPASAQFVAFDQQQRIEGEDWPSEAETMVGLRRLDNVQECVVDVLRNQVPGDLVETGVWRGGVTILMRGVLKAYGDTERTVWVADSFAGLPEPNVEQYPADAGYQFSKDRGYEVLAIPVDEVRANFARYGLLDEQVRFLVGWFRDTLPTAPIEQIAVLRLDGDLYESTMDALNALYPKLSVGGYLVIDDYYAWEPCQKAVHDYRATHGISEPIVGVDWTGAYWQRTR